MSGEFAQPRHRLPAHLSDKALQLAHDFLSALFMGVRTAQIHDASNAAYTNGLNRVHESASALYSAVGAFDVKVVDQSFFVNGVQLRFQGKTFQSMRNLAGILESQQMGGFVMQAAPTHDAVQRLISVFATSARAPIDVHRQALADLQIGVLGLQRLADDLGAAKVDRRVFAVHSYAKLILGLREHAAIIEHAKAHGLNPAIRPRIRVVRVIQDLAELCTDRLDLLLKLASNASGADPSELTAANACVLSLALGHALELHRRDLGDLGMAALFCQLGGRVMPEPQADERARNAAGLARLLSESGVGQGLYLRAMVLTEQVLRPSPSGEGMRRAHPFSRLVRVAIAYARLITGVDQPQGQPLSPLEALNALRADHTGWFDPRFVDLLMNLLRVYPRGTPVVLSTGDAALVAHANVSAFDGPQVRVAGHPPTMVDLMNSRHGGPRVAFTQMFLGTEPAQGGVVGPQVPQPTRHAPQTQSTLGALPSLHELALSHTPPPVGTGLRSPSVTQPLVDDLLPPSAPAPAAQDDFDLDLLDPFEAPADSEALSSGEPGGTVPPSAYSDSAPNRLIGTYLAGKYRILEKIGEGGMGAVYIANQEPIDRKVAVKVLLSSLAGDEIAVKRFEREAKTISLMRHPNTVTIHDSGKTAANELYIVMEYLEGETLADLIQREGAITPDRATRIIRQACASLSEAHEAGIVHRDLKPDNIFLTRLGEEKDWVKVLDFGLAKLADNDQTARITQNGKVFGTPRYMSPEQAQGLPLDARSDLYTLAVVLHELLTGRALFQSETMVALLVKHISEPPPLLSSVRPDLHFDHRLESVLLKALAKEPENRLPSMSAFASALEPFAYPTREVTSRASPRADAAQQEHEPRADKEDLDGLLSDFLKDLTPLDDLINERSNPFASYTPSESED